MGRKNRDLAYLKPFCFYCDKTFKNEVYLHQHQKAKHFTCQRCQKKFSSCDSLKNHAESAHHETLTKIPNALQDRNDIKNKIFGMQGVPRIEIEKRIRRGAEEYWTKVLQAQFARTKKELKARQKQMKEREAQKNYDSKKQQKDEQYQAENENYEYDERKAQPIQFNIDLSLAKSDKINIQPTNAFKFGQQ